MGILCQERSASLFITGSYVLLYDEKVDVCRVLKKSSRGNIGFSLLWKDDEGIFFSFSFFSGVEIKMFDVEFIWKTFTQPQEKNPSTICMKIGNL